MRKHLFLIAFAILSSVMICIQTAEAENCNSKTVMLQRCPNNNTEYNDETEYEGTRIPARPLVCFLTQTTIDISGIDIHSIVSFEAYSSDGSLLNVSYQQEEFCSFIFTYHSNMEIRLIAQDYILRGFLSE